METINIITFEEFKNEISSKNDNIKNQSDMWWIELKSDLLYYTNYSILEENDNETMVDLVEVLLVYMAHNYINLYNIEKNKRDDWGDPDPETDDFLEDLNNRSIKLRNIDNKDFIDFLVILIKYVKSTPNYEDFDFSIFGLVEPAYNWIKDDEKWGRRRGRGQRGRYNDVVKPHQYLDVEEIFSVDDYSINNLYHRLYIESIKLIEYLISVSYTKQFGELQDINVYCGDLFHSYEKFSKKGKDSDGEEIFIFLEDEIEAVRDYKNYKELKATLNKTNKSYMEDVNLMEQSLTATKKRIGPITDWADSVVPKELVKKQKGLEDETVALYKIIDANTAEIENVTNKLNLIKKPELMTQEQIVEEYNQIYNIIQDIVNKIQKNWAPSLEHLKKTDLIEQFNIIKQKFENIILGKIFVDYWNYDTEKIIDKCFVKEIEIYETLLSKFLGGNYVSLKKYYEDVDGRKNENNMNIDNYNFVDIIVCLDKHIKQLKESVSYGNSTRLKFMYQPGEQRLLEDSDEELESLNKLESEVELKKKQREIRKFKAPDNYFKKHDHIIFRETKPEEIPWLTQEWSPAIVSKKDKEYYNYLLYGLELKQHLMSLFIQKKKWSKFSITEQEDIIKDFDKKFYESTEEEEEERAAYPPGRSEDYHPFGEDDFDDYGGGASDEKNIKRKNDTIIINESDEDESSDEESDSDSDGERFGSDNFDPLEKFRDQSYIDDTIKSRFDYGTGKILKIFKSYPGRGYDNGSNQYAVIKWTRPFYHGDPPFNESYEKQYDNWIIVKPITAIKKIEDLNVLSKTKVRYDRWWFDKLLIDENRFINGQDIYKFGELYPWPSPHESDGTNLDINKIYPPPLKTDDTYLLECLKNISRTHQVELPIGILKPQWSMLMMDDISPYLEKVLDKIIINKNSEDAYLNKFQIKALENMQKLVKTNVLEVIFELYTMFNDTATALPGLITSYTDPDTQKEIPVNIDTYIDNHKGTIINIATPKLFPNNTLDNSIAYIKTNSGIVVQRLLRNLEIDYSEKDEFYEELQKYTTKLEDIEKIKDEYSDLNIDGMTTLYVNNPFRKNRDIYNESLKKLGMSDLKYRIFGQQTKFKDKDIKMLEFAKEKAKTTALQQEDQEISVAPEYLKWMKFVKKLEKKDLGFDGPDDEYKPGEPGKGAEEYNELEAEEVKYSRLNPQPTDVELEWFNTIGITREEGLYDPEKTIKKAKDKYRTDLGTRFTGIQDLRKDILNLRPNSNESSESRRINKYQSMYDTIDRNREARIRGIEHRIRQEGMVSSDEEDDPYGIDNMFGTDSI